MSRAFLGCSYVYSRKTDPDDRYGSPAQTLLLEALWVMTETATRCRLRNEKPTGQPPFALRRYTVNTGRGKVTLFK